MNISEYLRRFLIICTFFIDVWMQSLCVNSYLFIRSSQSVYRDVSGLLVYTRGVVQYILYIIYLDLNNNNTVNFYNEKLLTQNIIKKCENYIKKMFNVFSLYNVKNTI